MALCIQTFSSVLCWFSKVTDGTDLLSMLSHGAQRSFSGGFVCRGDQAQPGATLENLIPTHKFVGCDPISQRIHAGQAKVGDTNMRNVLASSQSGLPVL
eukprot:6303510-Amphidinium_carterae.1